MKHLIVLIMLSAVTIRAEAQFEYIKLYTVQAGMKDNDKAVIVFPTSEDSSTLYTNFKLRDVLLAVEMMEYKGFELVSINSVGQSGVVVTIVYMKRKKHKKGA